MFETDSHLLITLSSQATTFKLQVIVKIEISSFSFDRLHVSFGCVYMFIYALVVVNDASIWIRAYFLCCLITIIKVFARNDTGRVEGGVEFH